MKSTRRILTWIAATTAGAAVLIQLVPYGRSHHNPPVVAEPAWASPQVRELAVRACFDCHSNESRYPWYASVAPVSWLLQHDIDEGREILNFSDWTAPHPKAKDSAKEIAEGEMPPAIYVWMHPEARLSPAERETLMRGLSETVGAVASGRNGD